MNPERYMVTAVPVGGGERVTGYLVFVPRKKRECIQTLNPYTLQDIDPATIEPVKLPPIDAGSRGYQCPSCGVYFAYTEHFSGEWLNTTPYCGNCGQALDWEGAGDRR